MWQYGGMDVPFCDPSLTNTFGLGNTGYWYGQPTFGTIPNTFGTYNYGTPTWGFTPFTNPFFGYKPEWNPIWGTKSDWNPFFGYKPEWNPFFGYKTEWNPFLGQKTEWNPFFGYKPEWNPFFGYKQDTMPFSWGTPWGIDKFNTVKLNTMGINPWFTGTYGFNQTLPFSGPLGWYGTQYGTSGYTPFGFTGLDEKFKFNTPFSTGLYNFQTTPIDWKLKSFGTQLGMTPETWSKPVYNNVPWTTGHQGPVAVL